MGAKMSQEITTREHALRSEFLDNRSSVSFLNNEIRLKEVLRYKNSGRLLDVGCALGFFLNFAQNYFETYGIEISAFAVEKAKKIASHSKISIGSAEDKILFDNEFFDTVTLYDVLEHLIRPQACLDEIFRILKKNGYLFLQTPTDTSQRILPDPTHVSLFSKKELFAILEKAGFKIIDFERRRSILYMLRLINKARGVLSGKSEGVNLDSYDSITQCSDQKVAVLKKIKFVIYHMDRLVSKVLPAPEMFLVAQKSSSPSKY
jgi:2-polyprenyl-3-methyl-5-hydroxy-6-metoxy-1,4-benzoquinol methylase